MPTYNPYTVHSADPDTLLLQIKNGQMDFDTAASVLGREFTDQELYRTGTMAMNVNWLNARAAASGTSVWESISEPLQIGLLTVQKWFSIQNQQVKNEIANEQARVNLQQQMAGEGSIPGFGGLNFYTLAALGGIMIMAWILLKKTA
ncbi:MAG: hypothetical protein KAV87_51615 [Desulfobacteraceae bacterium]|nr:hypothetical protein [Desulfobacteraceae bacterium]